jgi:hypothetical protein
MSDRDRDDLARQAADLARSLRDLQRELEPDRRRGPRPPSPRELLRFTDEVAIPGLILLLETNIRALKLLQRSIRLADPGEGRREREGGSAVRDTAVEVSQETLSRLDSALADLQEAIEGRPENDEAREVLDDARSLRAEINDRLAPGTATDGTTTEESASVESTDEQVDVPVDVDAELQSIKDQVHDDSGGEGSGGGTDDG